MQPASTNRTVNTGLELRRQGQTNLGNPFVLKQRAVGTIGADPTSSNCPINSNNRGERLLISLCNCASNGAHNQVRAAFGTLRWLSIENGCKDFTADLEYSSLLWPGFTVVGLISGKLRPTGQSAAVDVRVSTIGPQLLASNHFSKTLESELLATDYTCLGNNTTPPFLNVC